MPALFTNFFFFSWECLSGQGCGETGTLLPCALNTCPVWTATWRWVRRITGLLTCLLSHPSWALGLRRDLPSDAAQFSLSWGAEGSWGSLAWSIWELLFYADSGVVKPREFIESIWEASASPTFPTPPRGPPTSCLCLLCGLFQPVQPTLTWNYAFNPSGAGAPMIWGAVPQYE